MMNPITIENVGPIVSLSIPIPENGGIVVLEGANGAGKSEALNATKALIGGTGSLNRRDGVAGAGRVAGMGATITVAKKTTRHGTIAVEHLEDRLNVATLVDPGVKDATAADRQRIRAIIALSSGAADIEMFRPAMNLLGDQPKEVLTTDTLRQVEILDMAAGIKRDLEAAAREHETNATKTSASIEAAVAMNQDIDLTQEDDAGILQKDHGEATAVVATLRAEKKSADEAAAKHEQNRQGLEEAKKSYQGPSLEWAKKEYDQFQGDHQVKKETVDRLTRQLAEANAELSKADESQARAGLVLKAARDHVAFVDSMTSALGIPPAAGPDDETIQTAVAKAEESANAIGRGAAIRAAKKRLADIKQWRQGAANATKAAAIYRTAAKSIDQLLSDRVHCESIKVMDGRLVTEQPGRGQVYYGELSEGQRWKIALDIAIDAIGEGGVLVIPQTAWEGLDPDNRKLIADHVCGRRVTVITAQCASGSLRATMYGGENQQANEARNEQSNG